MSSVTIVARSCLPCIMKVMFVFLTLAALAAACDENGHGCNTVTVKPFEASLSCPWKVTSDDITINNPLIQQSNPGVDCPFLGKGLSHLNTCKACGNAHVPCNNTFTACGGCCQTQNDIALKEHNCADVKSYFRWRNECPLNLMEATLDDEPDTSAVLQPVIRNHSAAKVLAEGNLTDKCSVKLEKFDLPKIPAIIQFDCNPCNIGSADLMTKCCNECVRFSTSETLANMTMIEPFVVCGGCQTSTINIPWEGTVIQQPWKDAGKYDNYSHNSQQDGMDSWVEKNICASLAKDTCPTEAPTTQAPATQAPTTQAPSTTSLPAPTGPCVRHDDGCVSTGGYPYSQYGDLEECEFTMPSLPLQVQGFDTEPCCDKLLVNGQYYMGQSGPAGIIPVGPLVWKSDGSVQGGGFKICPPKPRRRLREAVSTTTTTTRETLAAECRRLLASTTSAVASTVSTMMTSTSSTQVADKVVPGVNATPSDDLYNSETSGTGSTMMTSTSTAPVADKAVPGVNATFDDLTGTESSGSGSVSVLVAVAVMACSVVFV